ncbi:MAG TPA: hypothetical protein VK206_20930 [Anaerolineales bacterium]|nr:hypothetical protein [Anaerolineales bacterium]
MDPRATVQALMDVIQTGDFEKVASLRSDDFSSDISIVGMVLAWPWMGIGARLKAAFPDLNYGFHIESVDGNIVKFSTQIHGTHTGDLDLTLAKRNVIPVTYKSIATPREYGIATVRNGKVIAWAMESISCTSLQTILRQLGVKSHWLQFD